MSVVARVEMRFQVGTRLLGQHIGDDVDAGIPQHPKAAPAILGMWVDEGDVDRPHPPGDQLLCTRGRALMKRAGLQGHKGGNIRQIAAQLGERVGLGVVLEGRLGETASDHMAVPYQHAPDRWVGQASGQCPATFLDRGTHKTLGFADFHILHEYSGETPQL